MSKATIIENLKSTIKTSTNEKVNAQLERKIQSIEKGTINK